MAIFRVIAQGDTEHFSARNEQDLRDRYECEGGGELDTIESITEINLEETKSLKVHFEETGETMTIFDYLGGRDQDYFEFICSTGF
jgi:pyoverdine/dityrosine biosynthesis protein Dit1